MPKKTIDQNMKNQPRMDLFVAHAIQGLLASEQYSDATPDVVSRRAMGIASAAMKAKLDSPNDLSAYEQHLINYSGSWKRQEDLSAKWELFAAHALQGFISSGMPTAESVYRAKECADLMLDARYIAQEKMNEDIEASKIINPFRPTP